MSRQNKVNPGMYTQRGRLTQDDAARELKRQRNIGSEHTWQPVQKDQMPNLNPAATNDASADDQQAAPEVTEEDKSPVSAKSPAKRTTAAKRSATAKAVSAKKRAVPAQKAKRATAAKSAKAAKRSAKSAKSSRSASSGRKAVLARNTGGGAPKARKTAKRRKS